MEIDWTIPGIPINKAVYSDARGKALWIEESWCFSNAHAVGEFMMRKGVAYIVAKVAFHEGTMYVNLELERVKG